MPSAIAPPPIHEKTVHEDGPPLFRSNQGKQVEREATGWMRSTSLDTSLEEMRERYNRDGYIWIKNLIPREDVYDIREHYFQRIASTGVLLPSTSPRDGIFDPANDPIAHQGLGGRPITENLELLDDIHADPFFQKLHSHPALRSFIRRFMGWEKDLILERTLLRHNCPGSLTTGVHYDQLFLRGGEPEFLTAWVPIGDCAVTGGGLMYLENSDQLGKDIETEFAQNAKVLSPEERISAFNAHMSDDAYLSHDAEEFGRVKAEGKKRWLVADYDAGDVVFHTPHMIHSATKNEDELGRIRLASDLRFYEQGANLDQRWRQPYKHDDKL